MTKVAVVAGTDLAAALSGAGFSVERTAAPPAGGDAACLVVDLSAPEADGTSVDDALAATGSVPVVAVGDADDAEAVVGAGASFVHRGSPPAVVVDRVERAVERRRQARRAETLFENPIASIGLFDPDGTLRVANERAGAFVGVDPDDLEGTHITDLPHFSESDVDEQALLSDFEAALAGDLRTRVVQSRDSTGAPRTIHVTFRPAVGEGAGVVVAGRPVAQFLDTDERVPEPTSRRLRAIVENVPMVLFALDETGTFTLNEGKGLERLGVEPGEFVGQSVFEAYEGHDDILEPVERALAGERANRVQEVDDVAFETWYEPVFDDDGGVRSVIGVSIDVTERVERERDLEQYETIVRTVPDGVFVIDADGVILQANATAAELFGYERSDLVGAEFAMLVEDGVVDQWLVEEYRAYTDRLLDPEADIEEVRFEHPIRRPDGEQRIIENHVALRPTDGEFRGTIGVSRDVTDRKRTEQELRRQNERLEKLASVVSHDLRNPLNVAQGTAEMLQTDDEETLDTLVESLDRMAELIEELLELARTGQSVTDPEPVPLPVLAEAAWGTVAAPDATLSVPATYTPEVDRSRMRQLLENLFRNAVEHAGPEVTVTVGDLPDEPGFYVADDGPGIPEDDREEVFEYGFSTDAEGTGLGLAIVREVAEAHGWSVSVAESEAGGARFEFREAIDAR